MAAAHSRYIINRGEEEVFQLEKHPACTELSFQEARSFAWLQANPGMGANLPVALLVHPRVQAEALEAALAELVVRYDALRTTFHVDASGAFFRQVDTRGASVPVTVKEMLLAQEDDAELAHAVTEFGNLAFGAADACLLRALVIHICDERSVLVLNIAHLITDGSGNRVLIKALWDAYTRHCSNADTAELAPASFDLRDFVGSQRSWAATRDFRSKLATLADRVAGNILSLQAHDKQEFAGEELSAKPAASTACKFDAHTQAMIEAFAAECKVTPFVVLFALCGTALSRIYERRAFFMVFTFANRLGPQLQEILGFLSNQVPIFVDVDPATSFRTMIGDVNRRSLAMMSMGAIPYSELSREVLGASQSIRNVLNRYMLTMIPPAIDLRAAGGMTASGFTVTRGGTLANDMQLGVRADKDLLSVLMRLPADEKEVAERYYVPMFRKIVHALLERPDEAIGRLALGSP